MKHAASCRFRRIGSLCVSVLVLGGAHLSASAVDLEVIPKPAPITQSAEAGRNVAVYYGDILVGADTDGYFEGSLQRRFGSAYLYMDGASAPYRTYKFWSPKYENMSFAADVAISGSHMAITAPRYPVGDTGLTTPAVFVVNKGNSWPQCPVDSATGFVNCEGILEPIIIDDEHFTAANTPVNDFNVAVENGWLVVANAAQSAVLIYRFDRSTGIWSLAKKYVSDSADRAGESVAISGSRVAVGAPDARDGAGEVLIFEWRKSEDDWVTTEISAAGTDMPAQFGRSIDISGGSLAVAAGVSANAWIEGAGTIQFYSAGEGFSWVAEQRFDYPRRPETVAINNHMAVASFTEVTAMPANVITYVQDELNYGGEDVLSWREYGEIAKDQVTSSNQCNNFSPDFFASDVDLFHDRLVLGWRGLPGAGNVCQVGGVVIANFASTGTGVFNALPLEDNAEGAMVWSNSGEFAWLRHSGPTPSTYTGPSGGAGGSEHYYYVETSNTYAFYAGDTAILASGYLDPKNAVLEFDYHMLGTDMGDLFIDFYLWGRWYNSSRDSGIMSIIGSDPANRSADWQSGFLNLDVLHFAGPVKIRFRYVAAGGYNGDVALDNIRLYKSSN